MSTPPIGIPSASPQPRRLRAPSWLDLRLVAGVLLVIGSVLIGARVIAAADQSVSVWAAVRDLSAGTTLRTEDVRQVPARLFDASTRYLRSDGDLTGQVLDRPVRAGELVPASALGAPSDRVSVALPVDSTAVPLDLHRGQLVDVYATGTGADGTGPLTRRVLTAAPVQAVDGGSQGVLSAGGTRQVVVSVDAVDAGALVAAIAGQDLALAVLDDLTAPAGQGPPGPPVDPAPTRDPTAAPGSSAGPAPPSPPAGASTTPAPGS